jgi:hypothetical protein
MNASDQITIESLRERWRAAQSGKMSDELIVFSELTQHPDCCWQDLLDALDRPNMVGDDAWLQLRVKLKGQVGIEGAVRRDRAFWDAALRARGIDPQTKCPRKHT